MSSHVVESTSELSAYMKAGVMACSERDAGFCSGGDEDDMSGLHSPSASEDSVEVQVTPISLRNKRKLAEPRKIQEQSTAPLKKRRFERIEETVGTDEETRPTESPSPFRPWSTSSKSSDSKTTVTTTTTTTTSSLVSLSSSSMTVDVSGDQERKDEEQKREEEESRRRHEARIQREVLLRLQESNQRPESPIPPRSSVQRREPRQRFEPPPVPSVSTVPSTPPTHPRLQEEPLSLVLRGEMPRVPSHPAVSGSYERNSTYPIEQTSSVSSHHHQNQRQSQQTNHSRHQGGQQRNYKNMTRERRIEANARERTRVHTISAAFDTLRRAIPAYSHNQKLSKLSVLRIACSYIMTLSKIVNTPEGEPANGPSLGVCVDLVSRTIQTEGKLRKRKED